MIFRDTILGCIFVFFLVTGGGGQGEFDKCQFFFFLKGSLSLSYNIFKLSDQGLLSFVVCHHIKLFKNLQMIREKPLGVPNVILR